MTFPSLLVEMGFGSNPGTAQASIVWTDVTPYVHRARLRRGRSSELDEFQAGSCTLELDNSDRRFDPAFTGTDSYLNLPGADGDNATTPDAAGLDILGDIDLRWFGRCTDWTPVATQRFLAKNGTSAAGGGYSLRHNAAGTFSLQWSDGVSLFTRTSTAAVAFADGTDGGVRATMDVDDGAGNHVVTFYTSTDGATWTQLGTAVTTAGTTSIGNGTGVLAVGSSTTGTQPLAGRCYFAEVRSGIGGTVVASPDFRKLPQGTTSFTDTQGNLWTLNGTASLSYQQSPYAPNVKPMVPVRVSATHNAVTYRLFTGFVAGWPQDYNPPNYARCVVECVDGFEVLRQAELPESVWTLNWDKNDAWYRLGETAGLDAADHGTLYKLDGEWKDTQLGAFAASSLLPYSTDGAATFDGTRHLEVPFQYLPFMISFWMKTSASNGCIVDVGGPSNRYQVSLVSGKIRVLRSGAGNDEETVATYNDGLRHWVVLVATIIYVDGVSVSITTPSGDVAPSNRRIYIGSTMETTNHYVGELDEVRFDDAFLLAGAIADRYDDAIVPWDGQSSGVRIGELLDLVDWPAADRDIDAGISVLGPARLGTDALTAVKAVEKVEAGRLYMGRDGKVVFRDRHHTILNTSVTATFGETGSAGELPYFFEGFRYKFDRDLVRNSVSANREGGPTLTVEDAASITANLKRSHPLGELLNVNDNEVRGRVEWTLDHYKDPLLRIESIVIRPQTTPGSGDTWTSNGLWAAVLGMDITQRHTVKRLPQNIGSAISTTVICEGVEHDIGPQEWTTRVYFSPADTRHYFILNTDELDDTLARLAY